MKTLNVIGCGKAGRTLARLFGQRGVFQTAAVLNRSLESSREAVMFVGTGEAVEDYDHLGRADVVMIAAADEAIESCCRRLCDAGVVGRGDVVFHLSGSLASAILQPAREQGALVASVHPVKSFADPELSLETFAGTFCAVEGDEEACAILGKSLAQIGARTFSVDPRFKTIYHAGTVVVSNYLVALLETGFRCFERSGIDRRTAAELIGPIVAGTIENVARLGPAAALTGPIARGESSVVARQCDALGQWDDTVHDVYTALGRVALQLSTAQGSATPEALAAVEAALGKPT